MLTKIFSLLASLTMGLSAIFTPGTISTATITSINTPLAATQAPANPNGKPATQQMLMNLANAQSWPYKGDKAVRQGLVLSVVAVTGQTPVQVWTALGEKKSIADIAASAGKTDADVLKVYDETVKFLFDRAVQNGKLPASMEQGRIDWYQNAGRQMIQQPGLAPAYPGLHELHATIILAAVKVGGLDRATVRNDLKACQTLDQILSAKGHTGQEAVDAAMGRISGWLDQLVQSGKLSGSLRQSWETSIRAALTQMLAVPGLHVAGKACAG